MSGINGARTLYNVVFPVALGAGMVASLFHAKLREARRGRRGFRGRWRRYAATAKPHPVWFHVASVGEFEQARPVISALRRAAPETPVVVTFSSPSGYHYAMRKETPGSGDIDFVDYLPVDSMRNMRFCLATLEPRLLVLVKFDLWPNLIWEASAARVPTVLIDATLSATSKRRRGIAAWLYRSVYSSIDHILAISEDDADRFRDATPGHRSIAVIGDTRFDRVMERKEKSAPVGFSVTPNGAPVVIAGSTWPKDEAHLLPALRAVMRARDGVRAIIAPHEPTADRVSELLQWAADSGFQARRATESITDARVIVVDTVGVLAEAYALADVAYVGGAFSTGVHSVIEPAIASLPVLFGPLHENSFEALQLARTGAGFAVAAAADIEDRLATLLDDEDARGRAGASARAYVESQLGATEKCMAIIAEYL